LYPFGLKHKGYNNTITGRDHKYGFGGKEYNDELGLNWYDVSARNYDPALGRWMNLDPLAEQMRRHSPYNYAFDNPVFFFDPDGMAPDWIRNEGDDGTITYEAEAGDSAWSLYQQHGKTDGFSAQEANSMVEGQLGKNYTDANGNLKSDVEVGDTVTSNSGQGQHLDINLSLNSEILPVVESPVLDTNGDGNLDSFRLDSGLTVTPPNLNAPFNQGKKGVLNDGDLAETAVNSVVKTVFNQVAKFVVGKGAGSMFSPQPTQGGEQIWLNKRDRNKYFGVPMYANKRELDSMSLLWLKASYIGETYK